MLGQSVNDQLFSKATGRRTIKFWQYGGASAYFYLILKNVIVPRPQKPAMCVIFFRDVFLTRPNYRVTGRFGYNIDDMSNEHEPLVDRLAYLQGMDPVTYGLSRYCPLYQQKEVLKPKTEQFIKDKSVALFLGLKQGQADEAINRVFANENLDQHLFTLQQQQAEAIDKKSSYDFPSQVEKSFLPHIIKIAKQNGIELVFIRYKKREHLDPENQPDELKKYIQDLADYLAQNNAAFIDFTSDKRVTEQFYADGDHMTQKGMAQFTLLFAEEMKPLIEKSRRHR